MTPSGKKLVNLGPAETWLPPEPTNYARGWDHGYESGYAARYGLVTMRTITRRERDAIVAALKFAKTEGNCALSNFEIRMLCKAINQ